MNYPSLGEVPPRPSLLVQSPDLLLLLLSRSPQEAPAWKKSLFKPVFPEGDDALHQSQPSQVIPRGGGQESLGGTHREGGGGWDGLGWSSLGRKEPGSLCQPALHPCPGELPEPRCPARLLSCHQQCAPGAGDITACRGNDLTGRAAAARCQVMAAEASRPFSCKWGRQERGEGARRNLMCRQNCFYTEYFSKTSIRQEQRLQRECEQRKHSCILGLKGRAGGRLRSAGRGATIGTAGQRMGAFFCKYLTLLDEFALVLLPPCALPLHKH